MSLTSLLVALIVVLALLVAARALLPRLSASVAAGPVAADGGRRLADCPGSPNCRGSDASREGQRVAPWPLVGDAAETMRRLVALVETEPRASVVRRDGDYLHALFRTPLMGYVDDVEFLVDAEAGSVRVRSASRVGRSDLGANAKRLARLRERWDELSGAAPPTTVR